MTKIKVIIPITSISVNTIQHHLPSREGKRNIMLSRKGKQPPPYGTIRISEDIVIIISQFKSFVNKTAESQMRFRFIL